MLFDRYYAPMTRFFANKVGSERDELVQRTFSICVEKVDRLADVESFRSFLFGIARYELLHHYRRARHEGPELDSERDAVVDLESSPSGILAKKQEYRALLDALRRIPLQSQVVLEMTYWERMTAAEVAAVLRVPVGTVKSRLRRAREALTKALLDAGTSRAAVETTMTKLEDWAADLRDVALR